MRCPGSDFSLASSPSHQSLWIPTLHYFPISHISVTWWVLTNLDLVFVSSEASAGFLPQDTLPMDKLSHQTVVNYVSPPFRTIPTPKLWYPIWLIIMWDISSMKSSCWCLDLPDKNHLCCCRPFIYVRWHNPFLLFSNVPYFRFHAPSIVLHFSYPSVRLDMLDLQLFNPSDLHHSLIFLSFSQCSPPVIHSFIHSIFSGLSDVVSWLHI